MQKLGGVFAAALTPLDHKFSLIADDLLQLLVFLARRGCHGVLLLGTTGEGPSLAPDERISIMCSAVEIRQQYPNFQLLAGTGTPSLEETVGITRAAFDIGMDGVVVLPPYYYRKAPAEGLFNWYAAVMDRAVPSGCCLLGYHIPAVSGVPLEIDLLSRLKDAYPDRFAGIKDSSGDPEHASRVGERFGEDLAVFSGNDRLFSHALNHSATGCITALANVHSPDLRAMWDAYQEGERLDAIQVRIDAARKLIDEYPPAPPLLKFLVSRFYNFPHWAVKPPLMPLSTDAQNQVSLMASAVLDVNS